MQFLPLVRQDRRLQLLIAAALLAVLLGFVVISPRDARIIMTNAGYWTILASAAWFGWSVWRLARESAWRPRDLLADGWGVPLLVAACGVLLLVHERYGFKILMDEIMLLGTSQGMHFDKHPVVAFRGHDLQGAFQLLDGLQDKRPLFHPFLVSVLHDLTGYRPENVFVLNTVLTFGLLGLTYGVVRRLVNREAGVLAVLLLTSLPLLAQNATGGGFELLNLTMIMATYALALRFAERRDLTTQRALLLCAALLAQTRYESVLFLLPVGLLVLWAWWTERRPLLTWDTALYPLVFVPVALHQKFFAERASAWELASQPGFDRPFSLSYVGGNLPHWLNFFFDTTGEQSNSLVLSTLGWLALPFALLGAAKLLLRLRSAPPVRATQAFFTLGFAAHTLLMLVYFWGRFDDPVIRRLSLPLNLWLALCVATSVAELLPRPGPAWRVLWGATGLGIMAWSLPSMSRHDYSLDYYIGREMEWRRDFIAAHPEKDYLFIDNNAVIWITHLVSATPVQHALQHKDIIHFNFQNRTFGTFYVFQRCTVDPSNGHISVPREDDLGPDFTLETVWERRFTPMTVSRISRIVAIKPGPTTLPVAAPVPLEKLSPEEREKARQAYFENMVKRLP